MVQPRHIGTANLITGDGMDITLMTDASTSLCTAEADDKFMRDLAEMDRILDLVGAGFGRWLGQEGDGVSCLACPKEDRSRFEKHRAALIACCRTLRERRSADPELILGLELMVGDLSHDQLEGFLARLPSPPAPPRRRRAAP